MRIEHRLNITSRCPVDGKPDFYACTVYPAVLTPVEEILAAVREVGGMSGFQEEVTAYLSRRLNARVVTVGTHSGVETTVEAP